MGIIFVYIIKSAFCLILFYLFYMLLLSRYTFHFFNRLALLSFLCLSFLIPLGKMNLRFFMEEETVILVDNPIQMAPVGPEGAISQPRPPITNNRMTLILLSLYAAGMVFCILNRFRSIVSLFRLMKKSRTQKLDSDILLMVHNQKIAPFSWMKFIFISQNDLNENGEIILSHELAHIHKKHSWDLLLTDICILFQWFNPASWLLRQEVQCIHEFEADNVVINQGIDAKQYQLLLIKKAVGTRLYSMANSFNHSSLKKRITMMLKEKSNPLARLKYLYALPLACLAMLAFAHPDVTRAENESIRKVDDALRLTLATASSQTNQSPDKFSEISENNKLTSNNQEMAYADNPTASQAKVTNQDSDNTVTLIKGKVCSSTDKQALPFVNILEKDASGRLVGHTTTQEDGSFEITVKNKKNSLQYSCVGFQSAIYPIQDNGTIILEENKLSLDETVVDSDCIGSENADNQQPIQAKRTPRSRKRPEAPVEDNLFVEELPAYPNGQSALIDYIRKTAKYPLNAKAKGVEGKVVCSCIVNTNGELTDIRIAHSIDPELDKEAIRIVRNMPSWIPGRQNGKNIAVKFLIPITFKMKK